MSEQNDSSQNSLNSISDITSSLSYKLEGLFSIDSGVYLKDLPEIKRRSAVIMASHLLFSAPERWKKIRPHLAACLYRHMSKYSPRSNSILEQVSSISCWTLQLDIKALLGDEAIRTLQLEKMESEAKSCLELVVANSSIIVVSYKLKLSFEKQPEDLTGFKISPEPHFGWTELIQDVDKAHADAKVDKFSGPLADRAICFDVRCNNITYVKVEKKFN